MSVGLGYWTYVRRVTRFTSERSQVRILNRPQREHSRISNPIGVSILFGVVPILASHPSTINGTEGVNPYGWGRNTQPWSWCWVFLKSQFKISCAIASTSVLRHYMWNYYSVLITAWISFHGWMVGSYWNIILQVHPLEYLPVKFEFQFIRIIRS